MKTKFFTLAISALLFSSISSAKIFRVGYTGLPLAGVDYTDMQAAHDAASAGDTIQIYSETGAFGAITKRLVILGFGYNLDVNTNLQAMSTHHPSQATLYFNAGSDGTIVSGVSGSFTIFDNGGANTGVSNITFERCNGGFGFGNAETSGPISNIKIISSVVIDARMTSGGPTDKPLVNLQVFNCILGAGFYLNGAGTTATIVNCVQSPSAYYSMALEKAGVLVKNCILGQWPTDNINTIYENCFFQQAQPAVLPAGSNNRWDQSLATLYNRLGGTIDLPGNTEDPTFDEDYYILKAGSPAINGGFNAANAVTNCGIYGGEPAYVYKLSGVPAVPAIYKLTAPGSAASTNPYNITISVRSNN